VSTAIRGVDETTYKEFCVRIDELRREFLAKPAAGGNADRIAVLNVQLYPIAKIPPLNRDGEGVEP
jgi:hypothetical protein